MKNENEYGIDIDNFSIEEEIAKFDDMQVDGWDIILRLYIRPNKTRGGIIITDNSQDEDQYKNCVGLVVKIAPACYLDPRYDQSGPWCKVGEWRTFPRHAGYKIFYKDIPIFIIKEDAVGPRVPDPRFIRREK
jgi:co-chaperonin GroES (HSP10)